MWNIQEHGVKLCSAHREAARRMVQALLNKGADVNGNFVTTSETAVSLTAEKGYAAFVELLRRVMARKQSTQAR
jgi:hypothetical protein